MHGLIVVIHRYLEYVLVPVTDIIAHRNTYFTDTIKRDDYHTTEKSLFQYIHSCILFLALVVMQFPK